MYLTKIKLFSVTSLNFGFILNATILIIQTTVIFKSATNPGIAQNVAVQYFLLTPYLVRKAPSLVVQTLIIITLIGYIQKMIIIIIIKTFFKSRTFSNDPEKVCYPIIITLKKCTTLKYLTKINRSPGFISIHVLLKINFDDRQYLLNCTKNILI